MSSSIYTILNGNKKLIVCFGGMALLFGGILPFEFLNYLSSIYTNECDLLFFIDKKQCWYHNGIYGITKNIHETRLYLNNIIANYDKVIFMGTSSGGYAAILFGSLCNVNYVIGFIPQTRIDNPKDEKYKNLKDIINNKTLYILHGDISVQNYNDIHHISHCENIEHFTNVKIVRHNGLNMRTIRDNGLIKTQIDQILFGTWLTEVVQN
jgi:hypothetical protein